MIKFYYTVQSGYLNAQINPDDSLGGFLSSTPIPNGELNKLFSQLPLTQSYNPDYFDLRAVMMHNEAKVSLAKLKLWFEIPDNAFSSYEVAVITPNTDCDGKVFMESISGPQGLPYYAEFHNVSGVDNTIDLGTLKAGQYLAIWIKRKINSVNFLNQQSCDKLHDMFDKKIEIEKIEKIKLRMTWK